MASTSRLRLSGPCARRRQQQEDRHHRGGAEAAGEVAELGPAEQVVDGGRAAERHHADAEHEPDRPRDQRPAVAEQGDQRLREGEGEDERGAAEEQQREVEVVEVELVAEEDLADGRADGGAGDDAEDADADARSSPAS